MYQFISGIAFELTLIILFGAGSLTVSGIVKTKYSRSAEYQDWRNRYGRMILWICGMVILLCICSIIAKYIQFTSNGEPSLPD